MYSGSQLPHVKSSPYDQWFESLTLRGSSAGDASVNVIHRFLDGKPGGKFTPAERDVALWSSTFWNSVPDDVFRTEVFALAFAQYLSRGQEPTFAELPRALAAGPEACKRAIRYSKAFLDPGHPRWKELLRLLNAKSRGYQAFMKGCREIWRRYEHLKRDADAAYRQLDDLPLLDLLTYASVSAFKTELPPVYALAAPSAVVPHPEFRYPLFTDAVNRLLARRVNVASDDEFIITEERIRLCFRKRLYPLLLVHHDDGGQSSRDLRRFERYIDAQIRLDAFRQREVSAFCFDVSENRRVTTVKDESILPQSCFEPWVRSQIKGLKLRGYWTNRALATFAGNKQTSPTVQAVTQLLVLHDLYGVEDPIDLGGDVKVSLKQACLMLESAKEYYRETLLTPFLHSMYQHGDWAAALAEVIESGMLEDLQQRYPVIFASTEEKLRIFKRFTATADAPSGTDEAAEALLAFWGNNLSPAGDPMHRGLRQLKGTFAEQPFLKVGDYVFTLPWVLVTQDNASALVNNLRRIRSGRLDLKNETKRIEERLAEQMRCRGFRTVVGAMPPDGDGEPPGEIDLLAGRDGHLFVFEIKSGYLRQTFEAAWQHRANTLRGAGRQLQRKVAALESLFSASAQLATELGLSSLPTSENTHAWIVDTSVDFDRECFSGYPKINMTEFLIALRDESALLHDEPPQQTLYPEGFSAQRFVEVIAGSILWPAGDIE